LKEIFGIIKEKLGVQISLAEMSDLLLYWGMKQADRSLTKFIKSLISIDYKKLQRRFIRS